MPVCQNCHEKWTWWQTIKNLFRLTCPYCGVKQYQSAASKKKTSYLNAIPIIAVFIINVSFDMTFSSGIIIIILLLMLFIGVLPFYLKLANEEEFWF